MISYQEFKSRERFSKEELIAFSYGRLVEDPPQEFCRLPAPPFLMVDRISEIRSDGNRGLVTAEKDVHLDEWFFQSHFIGDPVQPGCLGVDAIWQILGFYCAWRGGKGSGRALGCERVRFDGQIRPHNRLVRYAVEVKRFSELPASGASIVIGSGRVFVDDEEIYLIEGARVGVFSDLAYPDYPWRSRNAVGGYLRRQT